MFSLAFLAVLGEGGLVIVQCAMLPKQDVILQGSAEAFQ